MIGNRCLPEWLRGKTHDDYYLTWTRWIPRSATSWCIKAPPIQLLGNQEGEALAADGTIGPKPIPRPGEWQLSIVQIKKGWPFFLPYFAWTTEQGTHFRLGARWDDVDQYYTFPSIAIAKPWEPTPMAAGVHCTTGETHKTSAASVVLFDKDKKVLWKTP